MARLDPKQKAWRWSAGLALGGLVVAIVVGLTIGGEARSATRASFADRVGSIAFEADGGLYLIDANGGTPRRIPGSKPGDGDPRWSPNGRQLAFDREDSKNPGTWDIYVMNADGSAQRRLTYSPSDDSWPRWAPNGRSLVFESSRNGSRSVYAINVRTGAARRVAVHGQKPDWAAPGLIIYAGEARAGRLSGLLFTVSPYGADRRSLASQPGNALAAVASHGGVKLVIVKRNFDLFIARSDGSGSVPLAVSHKNEENDPAWSPDDHWVVFDSPAANEGISDIYAIRRDGSEQRRLTHLGTACCADWGATPSTP